MFQLGLEAQGLLDWTQPAAPAFSGYHPPTPDLTPFFPSKSNEELRLAVSCLQRVTGKCSGVFIKETTGDHIPREGLLKVWRFQDPKALFVSSWTTAGLQEVTLGLEESISGVRVGGPGAWTLGTKKHPPSQTFLVALRGTHLHLRMVKLQAEGQTPMGIWLIPPPRAEF